MRARAESLLSVTVQSRLDQRCRSLLPDQTRTPVTPLLCCSQNEKNSYRTWPPAHTLRRAGPHGPVISPPAD